MQDNIGCFDSVSLAYQAGSLAYQCFLLKEVYKQYVGKVSSFNRGKLIRKNQRGEVMMLSMLLKLGKKGHPMSIC